MCVLIIDDASDTRRSIQVLLEAHGCHGVLTAASGQEALAILRAANPTDEPAIDVVLTDVSMPGLSGIEVCREIKATPHLRDIPVLMLTGCADEKTLEQAFAAGACDFITKAGSPTELLVRVRSALNLKRELDNRKLRERQLVGLTQQLKQLNEELQRLSILDDLTGVPNRRFFNVLLDREWGRAARETIPLSLIMIDVDFFKRYNDHYGHPQGDKCLVQVARTLQSLTKRPGDCVARYGGEEFVALLANTDALGALTVAESLRKSVEELGLEHASSLVHDRVTISVGLATMTPEPGSSSEVLLKVADQALYQAKAEGRNRVKVAPVSSRPVTQKCAT